MSENFTFNFSNVKGYTPYDGSGPATLLPFDGPVRAKLESFELKMSSGQVPKPLASVVLRVDEENLPPGKLYGNVLLGGKDHRDNDLGRQFADFMVSSGVLTADEIQAKANAGESINPAEVFQQVIDEDRWVYPETQAGVGSGKSKKMRSEVNGFVQLAVYERQFKTRTNRPTAATAGKTNGAAAAKSATGLLDGVL